MEVCTITDDSKVLFPAASEGEMQFMVSQEQDHELFVDVPGYGSVCIFLNGDDCLRIQVFPFHVVDRPIHEVVLDASAFSPPDEEEG